VTVLTAAVNACWNAYEYGDRKLVLKFIVRPWTVTKLKPLNLSLPF